MVKSSDAETSLGFILARTAKNGSQQFVVYSPFNYFASDGCRGGETGCGFGNFFFICGGDMACVIMVGCAKDEVGGEGKMVYPVSVGGQGADEGASGCVPYLDGFILRGGVDLSGTAPADT